MISPRPAATGVVTLSGLTLKYTEDIIIPTVSTPKRKEKKNKILKKYKIYDALLKFLLQDRSAPIVKNISILCSKY